MAKTDFKSVDEYVAAQLETIRDTLEHLRNIIRTAVPDADEVISYQIPAYKLPGGTVVFFAGWKQYFALREKSSNLERRRHGTRDSQSHPAWR